MYRKYLNEFSPIQFWCLNGGSFTSGDVHDVLDPEKKEARQETRNTGNGVAVGEYWRQRHPLDTDSVQEDQYLLKQCASLLLEFILFHVK